MKPDQRYAFACEHETYQDLPMIKVTKGWAARPIKVKNGGQKHVYGYDRKVKH